MYFMFLKSKKLGVEQESQARATAVKAVDYQEGTCINFDLLKTSTERLADETQPNLAADTLGLLGTGLCILLVVFSCTIGLANFASAETMVQDNEKILQKFSFMRKYLLAHVHRNYWVFMGLKTLS
jgi:hypothetical protein